MREDDPQNVHRTGRVGPDLRFAERVMTVVHTARKQGKDVLDFLVRTITAHATGATPPTLIGDAAPA